MGNDWAPNLLQLPSDQDEAKAKRWYLERQFMQQHKNDSDQQLLTYIAKIAEELGHPPKKEETVGYIYLKQRLGSWPKILIRAGIKAEKLDRHQYNRERDLRNQQMRDSYTPRKKKNKKDAGR